MTTSTEPINYSPGANDGKQPAPGVCPLAASSGQRFPPVELSAAAAEPAPQPPNTTRHQIQLKKSPQMQSPEALNKTAITTAAITKRTLSTSLLLVLATLSSFLSLSFANLHQAVAPDDRQYFHASQQQILSRLDGHNQQQQHQPHYSQVVHLAPGEPVGQPHQQQQQLPAPQSTGSDAGRPAHQVVVPPAAGAASLGQLLQQSAAADQQQQTQQQSPYWTNDLMVGPQTTANEQGQQLFESSSSPSFGVNQNPANLVSAFQSDYGPQQPHHQPQFVSYRPIQLPGPTTPTISRQIMPPPPFYELSGLTDPTSASAGLQIEASEDKEHFLAPAESGVPPFMRSNGARSLNRAEANTENRSGGTGNNATPRPVGNALGSQQRGSNEQQTPADQQGGKDSSGVESRNSMKSNLGDSQYNEHDMKGGSGSGSAGQQQESSSSGQEPPVANTAVDKTIEPRQRRRIFNRILKKAEWNHLFVELSKVFLRYFLDLALKDIIGKQSGGSDTTTSRKKLDAQSELTDLLKDFVKTAISNI